ncbi:MAG TPA: transglycosylase domain-containing protein [Ktedonobacteraceae bacterium]
MSSNWQQEPGNNHRSENNPPRATGGLLSSYGRLPSQQLPPVQQNNQPAPGLQPAAPAGPTRSGLLSQQRSQQPQIANGSQYPPAGLLGNTFQTIRGWSGKISVISNKMAAMAGYSVQPPAPYMERAHPPAMATPETVVQQQPEPWKRSRTLRIMMLMRKRRERWGPQAGRLWYSLAIACAALAVILSSSGGAYGYAYYQSQLPKVQQLAFNTITQTTRIYDRNMNLLYNAYDSTGRRTPVTYGEVPQVMQDAMVAAEDHTFWTNSGVDPQGITRAALSYFAHENSIQGGGSTLTQQVIKNLTGNNQETINRKIPEAALAIGLTQQYSKQKIMEMYFNVAGFGPLDIGIESAVEEYFHLMPQCDQNFKCTPGIAELDLNQQTHQHDPLLGLARASLMAGLPQNPVGYYPAGGDASKQQALARQQYVLDQMIQMNMSVQGLGPITPDIAQKAENLMANTTFTRYQSAKNAPHFVDWIIHQTETVLGNGDPNQGIIPFLTGGFNIRTTVDLNLENYVEATVDFHLTQPEFHYYGDSTPVNIAHDLNDAAVVVMDSHNGEILAMDGSADYNNPDPTVGGEYNAADPPPNADGTPAGRPPGSTFKPFVYGTAFEMGWYPGMIVPDTQTYFPNGASAGATKDSMYHPPDYSSTGDPNHYGGNAQATVRIALAQSQNVGAVRAMEYAGPENVLTTVHRLGLTQEQNLGISWALGTENASVLQMVDAYQAFANGGARIPSQGILDIWDNYGHNLYHYDPTHPPVIQVFSPQVAYLMTSALIDEKDRYAEFFDDHDLSFWDIDSACQYESYDACQHPVATKTGTTDGPKDTWTIGYTPNAVVGVWSGNANNETMSPGTLGIVGAAPIWHSIAETLEGVCPSPTYRTTPCPQNYNPTTFSQELGIGQQLTFTPPAGVHQACTSSVNGLLGSGNCDWVIDGEEPLQAGIPPNNNGGSQNGGQPSGGN